jgi:hypothetical protein
MRVVIGEDSVRLREGIGKENEGLRLRRERQ